MNTEPPSEEFESSRTTDRWQRGLAPAQHARTWLARGPARFDPLARGPARFDTTRWSLVIQASAADGRGALSELCRAYWAPVHAFIQGHGVSSDDAADVTQEFFESLLEHNSLARVHRQRGRFRSWLRTCARHHFYNWRERRNALKRGGRAVHVNVDANPPINLLHAERLYDRRWALTVIERALEQLRQRYERANKGALFDALYAGLSGDAREANDGEVALLLGKSVSAIRVDRHRLRGHFQACLKLEVADTVASASEIEDELRRLFAALS